MNFFKIKETNYIHIHIPKTAGVSISKALSENNQNYINLSTQKKNNIFDAGDDYKNKNYNIEFKNYGHAPISYIKPRLKINNINFVVVVRNPWARMFSLFQHTMMRRDLKDPKLLLSNLHLDTRSNFLDTFKKKSLDEVRKIGMNNIKKIFEFWLLFIGRNKKILPLGNPNFNILPQNWWFDENNSLNTSIKFFKYENLQEFENFLGFSFIAQNKNRFNSNDVYKNFYNDDTKKYVENLDSFVIEKFNYNF